MKKAIAVLMAVILCVGIMIPSFPVIRAEEMPSEALLNAIDGHGWMVNGDSAVPTAEYVDAEMAAVQDFIFDFDLDMSKAEDNYAVIFKIRHNKEKDNGTGYMLRISPIDMQLKKYNDNDWNTTDVSKVNANFRKLTGVRIVGNGANLWIAVDGLVVFNLTDAYAAEGKLYVIHSQIADFCTLSGLSLRKYEEQAAREGVTAPEDSAVYAGLNGHGWAVDGAFAVPTAEYVDAEMATVQDFIFDFNLDMSRAEDNYAMIFKLRHNKYSGNGTGYQLRISKNDMQLSKFNDNDWNATKVSEAKADFSKNTWVRIVGNGANLWIAVNGNIVFDLKDAYAEEGKLYTIHSQIADFASLSYVTVRKYSAAAANKGMNIAIEDPVEAALKANGWTVENGKAVTAAYPNGQTDAQMGTVGNFIFDFKLDMSKASDDLAVVYKIRHNKEKDNGTGYMLRISKKNMVLSQYNDNDWNTTKVAEAAADFSKDTPVRIAGNGASLWVAVDGVIVFSLTDAYAEEGGLWVMHSVAEPADFATMSAFSVQRYNDKTANEGITWPGEDPIYAALRGNGWTVNGNTAVTTNEFVDAELTTVKDFVFNFNLDMSKATDDLAVVYKIRHNKVKVDGKDHNGTGYMLRISKNDMQLSKYNDNDWNTTKVGQVSADFGKNTRVRIVGNGPNLWIAVDGNILFDLKDAYAEQGPLWVLHSTSPITDFASMSNISVLPYSKEAAEDGISMPESNPIYLALKENGWTVNGNVAVTTAQSVDARIADVKDFIFDFNLDMSKATEDLAVVYKLRHNKEEGHGTGYSLRVAKNSMVLSKYNDSDWNTTKLAEAKVDFSKERPVRIVGNGSKLWVAVDHEIVMEIEDAYAQQGPLWVFHSNVANFATMSYITVQEYDERKAMQGILVNTSYDNAAIQKNIEGTGWKTVGNKSVSTADFADAVLAPNQKDFIFNTTINMEKAADNLAVVFKIRHNKEKDYGTGYMLRISPKKMALSRYKDAGWATAFLKEIDVDFSKEAKLRIACNGDTMWIAIDSEIVMKVENAYAERGNLWVLHSVGDPVDFLTMRDMSVIPYTEADAMAGIKKDSSVDITDNTKPTVVDPNKPANVLTTKQEALNLFSETDCWIVNGSTIQNKVKTGMDILFGQINDYIVDFTLTISSEEPAFMSLNQRTGWDDKRNFGYTYQFYKNRVEFRKFNTGDYMSTPIETVEYDFTTPVKVRVVANEKKMWVLFDGQRVFEINDADRDDHTRLSIGNGFLKANTATITDLIIYKYDAAIAPADEGGKIPDKNPDEGAEGDESFTGHKLPKPGEDDLIHVVKPVTPETTAPSQNSTPTEPNAPRKTGWIVALVVGGVVLLAGAATAVLIVYKKKRTDTE